MHHSHLDQTSVLTQKPRVGIGDKKAFYGADLLNLLHCTTAAHSWRAETLWRRLVAKPQLLGGTQTVHLCVFGKAF